jgi:hypothetical protein
LIEHGEALLQECARQLPLLIPCLLISILGCSDGPPWVNGQGPMILITVDTLRADHLSCYGYQALSTPNIDRLAGEGVLFTDASATMPMTLPSHASIMTGLAPPTHGVRDNQDYFLPESAFTLAELFSDAGFETAAFVSAFVLDGIFGMDQGFSHYSAPGKESRNLSMGLDLQKDASFVTEETIQWIRETETSRFFLWIHYFDPHEYYVPPAEFLPPGRHPYDGEIAFVDDRLGRLIKALEREDLYDPATIVFLSDHGEGLGEHGETSHGFLTYQSTIRIPLIIKSPNIAPAIRDEPTSTTDIFPTLVGLFGFDDFKGKLDGNSLLPLLVDGKQDPGRLVYFESYLPTLYLGWSGQRGVRLGAMKLIESSDPELYDLSRDPHERTDLYSPDHVSLDVLLRTLSNFRAAAGKRSLAAGTPDEMEEEARRTEGLLALGYIGGTRMAEQELERIDGRVSPSERVIDYEAFLRDYLQGRVKEFSGDNEGALSLYERAAARAPEYYQLADLLNSAARCCLNLGKLDRAEALAREALDKDPDFLVTLLTLGQVADQRGDREQADRYYAECFRKAEEKGTPPPEAPAAIKKRAKAYLDR